MKNTQWNSDGSGIGIHREGSQRNGASGRFMRSLSSFAVASIAATRIFWIYDLAEGATSIKPPNAA
jgi:hypothetical protein